MHILTQFNDLSAYTQPIAWAIGVFDGLHIGHQAVIASAKRIAQEHHALSGVLTFDNHPLSFVSPEREPEQIMIPSQKWEILRNLGIDLVLNLPFDAQLASLSPHEFFHRLCQKCHVLSVSVGEDWHFGKNRAGNITTLCQYGEQWGFEVHIVSHIQTDKQRVSSTRIRQSLAQGDLEQASNLLGRGIYLEGTVIHGRQLARQLQFPTANIPITHATPLRHGVYAVQARVAHQWINGVANLGVRPTVEQGPAPVLLETHLFDFHGDLYGQHLRVRLCKKLRDERKFHSVDELAKQLHSDAREAQDWLVRHKKI